VLEREPVVIVADIEHLPEPLGQAIDETEIAAVGAAANPGRLDGDAEGLGKRSFNVKMDFLAARLANGEAELLLGGEELPVEEVFELAAVDGEELGARQESDLVGDGAGADGGHLDHGEICR